MTVDVSKSNGEDGDQVYRQRLTLITEQKDKGNELFKADQYLDAAKHYEKGYKLGQMFLARLKGDDDTGALQSLRAQMVLCLINLAMAHLRLENYHMVVRCCSEALEIDPHNEKAMFRRGLARLKLCDAAGAELDLRAVVLINPTNVDAKKHLREAYKVAASASERSSLSAGFNGMLLNNRLRSLNSEQQQQPDWAGKPAAFTGIRNEGATCYVNSVLQVLFHVPAVRHLVYHVPTDPAPPDSKRRVLLALQCLFHRLESSKDTGRAASAVEVFASFGWDIDDTFQQQCVGEILSVLVDTLDEALKEAKEPSSVQRLFHVSYSLERRIEAARTEEERAWSRKNTGSRFPFNVAMDEARGGRGLLSALANIVGQPTVISDFNTDDDMEEKRKQLKAATDAGDAKLAAECEAALRGMKPAFGRRNLIESTSLVSAPPMLFVQIGRVQWGANGPHKDTSRFEFPDHLDLDPYLTMQDHRASEASSSSVAAAVPRAACRHARR